MFENDKDLMCQEDFKFAIVNINEIVTGSLLGHNTLTGGLMPIKYHSIM